MTDQRMTSVCEVTMGVEEEFHVVDLTTRRAVPRAPELLDRLQGLDDATAGAFAAELKPSVIETNSRATGDLADLRCDLVRLRSVLAHTAEEHGLGVVGAGSVPLVDGSTQDITADPRYEQMRKEYQLLALEQQICGTQVHVDVADRDTAVAVMQHSAPWLPVLLALSASSPFWQRKDTGYASCRTLAWHRWPTAGPPGPLRDAADYDALIADLVASGTMLDPGMVYFDMRPSAHQSTVELRICDAHPGVDGVVLIAGLARALVRHGVRAHVEGREQPAYRGELLRAASWRAARSGLEGDLVDVERRELVPPQRAVRLLLDHLADDLDDAGDRDAVEELAADAVGRGSSAARQRRRATTGGGLEAVVDMLVAETRGAPDSPVDAPVSETLAPVMLGAYEPTGTFDEAVAEDGTVRPRYSWLLGALERIGPAGMLTHCGARDAEQRARGMFFAQEGERDRLFPLDLVPRLVEADEWTELSAGLVQRARTLEALLEDLHGERACLRDGVLPRASLRWLPGPDEAAMTVPAGTVRALVSGLDLVRDGAGAWKVLEDNLRIPSGIGYAIADRRVVRSVLPEIQAPNGILETDDAPAILRAALLAGAPNAADDDPYLVVVSEGPSDSAYFEHTLLAEEMGVPVLTPGELRVLDAGVGDESGRRIDVVYRRIDEEVLFACSDAAGVKLGGPLQEAVRAGLLAVSNTPGNGLVDDKAVYPHVGALTEYYFGEKALLESIPTWSCAEPDQCAWVLEHLEQLVLKPVDGYGGRGVLVGPHASADELERAAADLREHPAGWIAQETVSVSTHPTFTGQGLAPRAVDLRAFVVLGPTPTVLPTALTRVAPEGSLVVNSSRGGGSKDTWILR